MRRANLPFLTLPGQPPLSRAFLLGSSPHSRRHMPKPVGRHVDARVAARRANEAPLTGDGGEGRFSRKADCFESHGFRPKTIRFAAGHPNAGDALGSQAGDFWRANPAIEPRATG